MFLRGDWISIEELISYIRDDFNNSAFYLSIQDYLLLEHLYVIEGLLIYRICPDYLFEGNMKISIDYLYDNIKDDPLLFHKYQYELSKLGVTERCLYWLTEDGKERLLSERLFKDDEEDFASLIYRSSDTMEEYRSKLELAVLYNNICNYKYWY